MLEVADGYEESQACVPEPIHRRAFGGAGGWFSWTFEAPFRGGATFGDWCVSASCVNAHSRGKIPGLAVHGNDGWDITEA